MKILNSYEQFKNLQEVSKNNIVIIFKNSLTCGVSFSVFKDFKDTISLLESKTSEIYELVVQDNPKLKIQIADELKVTHESPQVLVIKDGLCIYHESHYDVKTDRVADFLD